jgi:DNA repair exonuclease SbcCD nuclease subunit
MEWSLYALSMRPTCIWTVPLRGLANTAPKLRDSLQAATLTAFERIVDHTIQAKADFLVLAGDLYDSKDRSLRALVAFRKQMERLAERDISVYIVMAIITIH